MACVQDRAGNAASTLNRFAKRDPQLYPASDRMYLFGIMLGVLGVAGYFMANKGAKEHANPNRNLRQTSKSEKQKVFGAKTQDWKEHYRRTRVVVNFTGNGLQTHPRAMTTGYESGHVLLMNPAAALLSELLSWGYSLRVPEQQTLRVHRSPKRVAVIGAGTSGLSFLKVVKDYKRGYDLDWDIVLFEKRHDVGDHKKRASSKKTLNKKSNGSLRLAAH
ncbi:uncharacterized protein EI90DRAFT_3023867 [Cantharellus anzutake]|uniref:uncharacterized protein n=1 Tax=Cantharellus anzutake TaxID=1750568 RepID=UPI00190454CD|nr:uncharacterized protein EI90DRAFT_3023867 [Cantharellus anzutake]KAF8311119.1 hypothetical protein EI90DRAFT_3023867 [Cantharellus anzutake]